MNARAEGSIEVLICDAQPLFAEALAEALEVVSDFRVIPEKPTSVAAVLEVTASRSPDVILLDFWSEGVQDEELSKILFSWVPPDRIIFLSWLINPEHVEQALELGAAGILPKSITVRELADAIRRVFEGIVPIYGEELGKLLELVQSRSQRAEQLRKQLAHLTPREMQILAHLSYGDPLDETAHNLGITPSTLKTHIRKILIKTGAQSQKEAIAMARYCGLLDN